MLSSSFIFRSHPKTNQPNNNYRFESPEYASLDEEIRTLVKPHNEPRINQLKIFKTHESVLINSPKLERIVPVQNNN